LEGKRRAVEGKGRSHPAFARCFIECREKIFRKWEGYVVKVSSRSCRGRVKKGKGERVWKSLQRKGVHKNILRIPGVHKPLAHCLTAKKRGKEWGGSREGPYNQDRLRHTRVWMNYWKTKGSIITGGPFKRPKQMVGRHRGLVGGGLTTRAPSKGSTSEKKRGK